MTPSIVQAGIGVVIAATLGGCATVGGGGLTSGDACDRDCLLATLDAHLAAVAANDPSHARLAPGFRATENAVDVAPGDGTWASVTGLGDVQRRYADAALGMVGYFGTVTEGDALTMVSVRLKVEDRAVTEAEWIIARDDMVFFNPEGFAANAPPQARAEGQPVPSRLVALAGADSYFSGIDESDGSIVRAHSDCARIENGTMTVGRLPSMPVRAPDHDAAGDGVTGPLSSQPASSCNSGFDNLRNVTEAVINRRYFVDPQAGVAWGTGIFRRVEGYRTSQGGVLPWLYLTEVFAIEDERVRSIHAVMTYLPDDITTSGWPDEE